MAIEDNKNIIRRYIEVSNTGKVDYLDEYISQDYIETLDPERKKIGVEGAKQHITEVRKTFPDLYLTIEKQIAEGERVVSWITARVTHLGEWLGIKPTGKKVEITVVNVDRIVNSRIVEHGGAANMFEALLGIDAIKIVTE